MTDTEEGDRIELSEAIKTILDDCDDDQRNKETSDESFASPSAIQRIKFPMRPASFLDTSKDSPTRPVQDKSGSNAETPISKKSSLLQRSLGRDQSKSPPKKRKHAHEVIILRPPKKRNSTSTPRITSTSKMTPNRSLSDGTSFSAKQMTPSNGSLLSRQGPFLESTPVSSLNNRRRTVRDTGQWDNCVVAGKGDVRETLNFVPLKQECLSPSSTIHLTPNQMYYLEGSENLTPQERERVGLQVQYLNALEQQGIVIPPGKDGMPNLDPMMGHGGLSLNVDDQTHRISLVARGGPGSQDDSLTNITWLRRMSAPELDPVTLQQLKDPHRERPPYSYSALIQFAISSAPEGKMTLRDIYLWIETNFPYFRTAKLGWKNSIRHNLSLHKIFVREAPSGPGQPAFWTLRPGTVVRLPERKIVIHEDMSYPPPPGMGECFLPPGVEMVHMGNPPIQVDPCLEPPHPLAGNNMMVGEPEGIPMMAPSPDCGPNPAPVLTSTPAFPRPSSRGSRRIPPILPKGTSPYALVPLPIYFTADPKTGQLIPASGDNASHMGLMSPPTLPGTSQNGRQRKIAPKLAPRISTGLPPVAMEQPTMSKPALGRVSMDSGYRSSDSGLGDDSKLGIMRDFMSGKNGFSGSEKVMKVDRELGKENVQSSDLPSCDIETDLLQTPPKSGCPDWLSPIRGLTPGPDNIFSSMKDMDFNFTPFKTGFTPLTKMGRTNTPRHLMLTPQGKTVPNAMVGVKPGRKGVMMTPLRNEDGDMNLSFHNSSFDQIFGDVNFDVDPDNIDVANISWLLQSPTTSSK